MKTNKWLIGLLCIVSLAIVIKGCNRDRDANPMASVGSESQGIVLQFIPGGNATQKAIGLRISVTGQNERNEPAGPPIEPITIANPKFPLQVNLSLFKPPCRYHLSVTTTLERDPAVAWSTELNICQSTSSTVIIDPYEVPIVRNLTIIAPDAAQAGQTIEAMCEAEGVNAPDDDRYPLVFTLFEQNGTRLPSVRNTLQLAGVFPDPYPLTAPQGSRTFICTIGDSRTLVQTVQKTIARIVATPLPLPTPIIIAPTPSGLAVTATAEPAAVEIGATSVITAHVTLQGNPVAGAVVNFAHPQGLGTLNPGVATTDAAGLASSVFTAGTTPGLATVYVSATASQGTVLAQTTVAIAAPTPTVTPTPFFTPIATPTSIPTPTPTVTPTPTSTATPTPTITPTATPGIRPCYVTNENDSGAGSLRQEAIEFDGMRCTSPITFAPGVSIINLTGGIGLPVRPLTIDGGASGVTVRGDGTSMVFTVTTIWGNVTLLNLTITNGGGVAQGGGIYLRDGQLTLGSGTVVTNNRSVFTNGNGGGIWNLNGTLTIKNGATVSNNRATSMGGGIYNAGTLVIESGGMVMNNQAGSGGGIYTYRTATIDGTITGNTARYGGGILISGGTTTFQSNNLIQGNTATGSGTIFGGGLFVSFGSTIIGMPNYGTGNTPQNCDGPSCP